MTMKVFFSKDLAEKLKLFIGFNDLLLYIEVNIHLQVLLLLNKVIHKIHRKYIQRII